MEKKRPGVMLYFEMRPCLRRLDDAQKGRLLEAILDYGEEGTEPKLEGMAALAWDFIRPRIDRDAEHYRQLCEQNRLSALRRWRDP